MTTGAIVGISIGACLLILFGIALMPSKSRKVALSIILLPAMWVISIITFPYSYIKSIVKYSKCDYNNISHQAIKVKMTDDGIDILFPNGEIKHYIGGKKDGK